MNNTFPTEGNLSGLSREDFQKEINDKKTDLFILKNTKGMEVAVTNYGCAILSIMVPDKNGKYANVILGHDSIDHVVNSPEPFLSTTIGRYGNLSPRVNSLYSAKSTNSLSTTGLTPCMAVPLVSMPAFGMLSKLTRVRYNSTMFLKTERKVSPVISK